MARQYLLFKFMFVYGYFNEFTFVKRQLFATYFVNTIEPTITFFVLSINA